MKTDVCDVCHKMETEIGLEAAKNNPGGHLVALQAAYDKHKADAEKQKKMLKDAEKTGPQRAHIKSGWRTICTGKYDFSFLGLIITKRKS